MKIAKQVGFTLIELMIALTLGLILVAVATQLLLSGQINYRIQSSTSSLLDSGMFGLGYVTKNIRLANHGNAGAMNDESLYGGIVLSQQTVGAGTPVIAGNLSGLKVATTLISSANTTSANANNNSAFTTDNSDQLVIMYQAPVDMTTCTGRRVRGPIRTNTNYSRGWYVVERYYIKKHSTENEADLYCADAVFVASGETVPQTFESTTINTTNTLTNNYATDAGELIAKNVEYMRIQLIVRNTNGTTRSLPINDYNSIPITTAAPHRPAVIGINLGWLVRTSEKVQMATKTDFKVFDKNIVAPSDSYMRQVYMTTIALRNGGLGDVIQ